MVTLVNNTNRTTSVPRVVTVKWVDDSGKMHGKQLFPVGHYQGAAVPAEPAEVPEAALKHPHTKILMTSGDVRRIE